MLFVRHLSELLRAAAEETRSRPRRVHDFSFSEDGYSRHYRMRVRFDVPPDVSPDLRVWCREVSRYELETSRASPPVHFNVSPVQLQELYEAHIDVLAARERVRRGISTQVPDISFDPSAPISATLTTYRNREAQDALEYAVEHLHRVEDSIAYRLSCPPEGWSGRYMDRQFGRARLSPGARDVSYAVSPLAQALSVEDIRRSQQRLMEAARRDYVRALIGEWPEFAPAPRWSPEAIAQGWKILCENLDKDQLAEFESGKEGARHFHVVGQSGTFYRICEATQMNVFEFDDDGRCVMGRCFLPQGDLVIGDVMLAQKVSLEMNEAEALAVANRFGGPQSCSRITKKRLRQLKSVRGGLKDRLEQALERKKTRPSAVPCRFFPRGRAPWWLRTGAT